MTVTKDEIRSAIDGERYPPILTPHQVAELFGVSLASVYRWSSEERFSGCVRRGRPLRFWRDGLIEQFFSVNRAQRRLRSRGSGGSFSAPR